MRRRKLHPERWPIIYHKPSVDVSFEQMCRFGGLQGIDLALARQLAERKTDENNYFISCLPDPEDNGSDQPLWLADDPRLRPLFGSILRSLDEMKSAYRELLAIESLRYN